MFLGMQQTEHRDREALRQASAARPDSTAAPARHRSPARPGRHELLPRAPFSRPRMGIEDRFARDREIGLASGNHPVRFAPAEPEPAPLIAITDVAHAMKNGVAGGALDLRERSRFGPIEVLARHDRARQRQTRRSLRLERAGRPTRSAIGRSSIPITSTSIPCTGLPTQTPKPALRRRARFAQDLVAADRRDRK